MESRDICIRSAHSLNLFQSSLYPLPQIKKTDCEITIQRSCITATASVWCYSSPDERAFWSKLWADRLLDPSPSSFAKNAIADGFATPKDIDDFVEGWREWGSEEDGWYTHTHGEILCRV